jgi:thioredoxin 1
MLKKLFITAICISAASWLVATRTVTKVAFANMDWETAQKKAIQDAKLFFVDFDANYCATCRNMEQSTYMDNTLSSYMSQNVVAMRVDVQDFDGVMLSQQYEVEALPTLLVFDASGKLVNKMVGYKSAKDLLKVFQDVQKKSAALAAANTPSAPKTAEPAPTKGGLQPVPVAKSPTVPVRAMPSVFGSNNNFEPSLDLYEVAVKKQAAKGFSLQVGSFGNYEAAFGQAEMFATKYAQKTIVGIDNSKPNQVSYKLFLGNFETRAEAQKLLETLKKNKVESLIRDLQTI